MKSIGIATLLGMVSAATPAQADLLRGWMRQPLTETAHTVEVKLDGGVARLTVRRTFHNDGEIPEEANLDLTMPPGAVASSLRLRTRAGWENATLLDSEAAVEEYEELTGIGDHKILRDPALLEWLDVGLLSLRVFPVPAGGQATVEYELVMPTDYQDGRVVLYYPEPAGETGKNLALPEVKMGKGGALARGARRVDPWEEEDDDEGETEEEAPTERWTRISLSPPAIQVMTARYGVFTVNEETAVWRLELDTAPELAPKPKDARVAFVIDASHSVGARGIAEQVALARGYMADLPDAKYEVIVFRRDATRLTGKFVSAKELVKELDRAAGVDRLKPGNGSNLEAGLAIAADALGEGKHKGASRIVVFTDGMMRDGFSPSLAVALLARAPKGTIVHVARRQPSAEPIFLDEETAIAPLAEERVDADPLAPVAGAYGGVVLAITGQGEPADYARVARGLVQPIRIDDFSVVSTVDDLGSQVPVVVAAGSGFRYMTVVDPEARAITVSGKLWAEPWTMQVPIDGAYSQRVGMLLFGDPIMHSIMGDDQRRIAMAVKVVSRYTSFLAVEPGTKPATQGVDRTAWDEEAQGGWGYGVSGAGEGGGGYGFGSGGDLVALLAGMLEPGARGCGALDPRASTDGEDGGAATVNIEATEQEIVDVRLDSAPSAVIGTCLIDHAWSLRLGDEYTGHQTYAVSVTVL